MDEVGHGDVGGLVHPRAGVVEEEQQGVIACALPRAPVGRPQEGIDLRLIEIRIAGVGVFLKGTARMSAHQARCSGLCWPMNFAREWMAPRR